MKTTVAAIVLALLGALLPAEPATARPAVPEPPPGERGFGLKWSYLQVGPSTPVEGIGAGDLDGDGAAEILVPCAQNNCWILLTPGGEGYRQLATSLPGTAPIGLLRLARLPGGELAVLATRGSSLEIARWNGRRIESRQVDLSGSEPTDLAVADLDLDGHAEIVEMDANDLRVYDYDSGALISSHPGRGGSDLDIGQLDADPNPEIAIATTSGDCLVLDGATFAVEWEVPSGCGDRIATADLIPGGARELVTITFDGSGRRARAWAPPSTQPLWDSPPYYLGEPVLAVGDVDPSPGDEILLGGTGWTAPLVSLRATDGSLLRTYWPSAVKAVALDDVDADGSTELVASIGTNGGVNPWVAVLDAGTGATEYELDHWWLQSRGVAAVDLDHDGDVELVAGAWMDPASSSEGPYAAAAIFSGLEGDVPVMHHLSETRWWSGMISQFRVVRSFGDPSPLLCSSFSVGYSYVGCFSGIDLEPLWSRQLSPPPSELLVADADGNGRPELYAERHWSDQESYVDALDPADGSFVWTTPNLAPATSDVDLLCYGELDDTPGPDLVAGDADYGNLSWIDPSTGDLVRSLAAEVLGGLECGDLDGDGRLELVAADAEWRIGVLNPQSGLLDTVIAHSGGYVRALAVGDLLGDSRPEIAVATAGAIQVFDAASGALLWSAAMDLSVDWYQGNLEILDVDGDGRPELVANDTSGIVVFGLPFQGHTLFVDGFESGDSVAWSRRRE